MMVVRLNHGAPSFMAKRKQFDKVAAVKSASRANIGVLPKVRVVPNKRKKMIEWRDKHGYNSDGSDRDR